jgi:hypothetical protein
MVSPSPELICLLVYSDKRELNRGFDPKDRIGAHLAFLISNREDFILFSVTLSIRTSQTCGTVTPLSTFRTQLPIFYIDFINQSTGFTSS